MATVTADGDGDGDDDDDGPPGRPVVRCLRQAAPPAPRNGAAAGRPTRAAPPHQRWGRPTSAVQWVCGWVGGWVVVVVAVAMAVAVAID